MGQYLIRKNQDCHKTVLGIKSAGALYKSCVKDPSKHRVGLGGVWYAHTRTDDKKILAIINAGFVLQTLHGVKAVGGKQTELLRYSLSGAVSDTQKPGPS